MSVALYSPLRRRCHFGTVDGSIRCFTNPIILTWASTLQNAASMAPDGTTSTLGDLEITTLSILNFNALESGDSAEVELLLESCLDDGLFYLDFGSDETGQVLEDVQGIYTFMKEYFLQLREVKMKDYSGGGQWG
jgi:hypothetical protein